ncbi:hypothetical protein IGK18_001982 [Enterococcus sp. DIV2446a]|nr:hypothetical protein EFQU50X_02099 [Enterococcus faecium]
MVLIKSMNYSGNIITIKNNYLHYNYTQKRAWDKSKEHFCLTL